MSFEQFWNIVTSAQVSTALVLIAAALVYFVFKMVDKGSSK